MKQVDNFVEYVLGWVSDMFTINVKALPDDRLEYEHSRELAEGGFGEIWQEELDRRSKGGA